MAITYCIITKKDIDNICSHKALKPFTNYSDAVDYYLNLEEEVKGIFLINTRDRIYQVKKRDGINSEILLTYFKIRGFKELT